MTFEPFSIETLSEISGPAPGGPGWGCGLLPFLRWLNGRLAWRVVATVEDGRGLAAPVLALVVQGGKAIPHLRLDATDARAWTPGTLDFVHVTAEHAPGGLIRALGPFIDAGGLILFQQPSTQAVHHPGALALPVADGVMLVQPHGPPNPVMAWLQGRSTAELAAFGALFDSLGTAASCQLDLEDVRARSSQISARDASETALRQQLEGLRANDAHLRAIIGGLTQERDALHGSTSWRATAPLRWAARRAARPQIAPAPPGVPPVRDEVAEFLGGPGRLTLVPASRPAVTVLLVVEDQAATLFACLTAIIAAGLGGEAEIVIAANGYAADTARLLDRVDGACILALEPRHSAADAFAAALGAADGEFVLLLDNRVRLRPGAVAAALATLRAAPEAGAVCVKLFDAAGAVIAAGESVDAAGTPTGRGQGLPITAPEVQYRCTVPSGSAMALLVRSRLLRRLGGLSPGFAETSLAGADLCRRLHEAGWSTLYEPAAEAVAQATPTTPAEAAVFAIRHPRQSESPRQRRLLMIDDRVPYPSLGAGYPRAARLVHELHGLGWQITYFPNHEPYDDWGSIYRQFPREVEFMLGYGRTGLAHLLNTRDGAYDTVVVSRPHNMRDYLAARHATRRPRRLVYDAEAVFATREFLRLERAGRPMDPVQRQAMLDEEIGLTASADIVTAVNAAEADIFRAASGKQVAVLGLGTEPDPIGNGLAHRRDLLFVGALGEDASPNADAVAWFVGEVMPLLDQRIGTGYRLLVAGRCRAPKILALASPRVQILGLVDELIPLYASARMFVAPTRYAAGLPLKVQEAVGRGLPVVGTGLLAEQLGWTEREMLSANTADGFSACCARLYTNAALWYALRRQGLDTLAEEARQHDFAATTHAIFGTGQST